MYLLSKTELSHQTQWIQTEKLLARPPDVSYLISIFNSELFVTY